MKIKNFFRKGILSVFVLALATIMFSCEDDYTYVFTDTSLPDAEFSYIYNELTVSFTNNSEDATTYLWDFGDGSTSTEANPAPHVYSTKDTYTVKLTAKDGNGVTSEISYDLAVGYPIALFDYVVKKNLVLFTNTSASSTSYSWDFGDGTTSTEESPSHTYAEAKEYTVTLTTSDGTDESTITKTIITTLKMKVNLLNSIMNAQGSYATGNTEGWVAHGCSIGNSSDSYDDDDLSDSKATKMNSDDVVYQVVDISDDADYTLSFYTYQVDGTGDNTADIVATIETVVDGGETPGTIIAKIDTKTTASKKLKNYQQFEGDFNTGTYSQVVIRFTYNDALNANQAEGRVDVVSVD